MADDVKILGMPAESGRWLLILIGTIIELCLGAVYAYSILSVPLKKIFTDPITAGGFGLTVSAIEMQLPYIVSLAMFAVTMPLVGKYIEKMGPRKVGMIGGVVVGLGWILASFATSPITLALLYGLVAGVGVGITALSAPMSAGGPWPQQPVELKVGDTAPPFALQGSDGKVHKLSDYRGTTVVLAWFPKAFTGG